MFCAVWEKVFAILLRILWKEISLQGLGFHVAGSNALVLLKIHWKSCIFPQFSFFPYPLGCCWWNKILSMKKFEGKKCMFTWVTFQEKPNVWFVLFTISLFNHRGGAPIFRSWKTRICVFQLRFEFFHNSFPPHCSSLEMTRCRLHFERKKRSVQNALLRNSVRWCKCKTISVLHTFFSSVYVLVILPNKTLENLHSNYSMSLNGILAVL